MTDKANFYRAPSAAQELRRPSLSEWLAMLPHLKRVGQEHVGPCPLCGGDDRFRVGEHGAFCRQCCPKGGPKYAELVRAVFGEDTTPAAPATPKAKPIPSPSKQTQPYALRIISESTRIRGTLGERYLVRRGLAFALDAHNPDALKFHPRLRTADGTEHPALIVVVTDEHGGNPVACQRIYLTDKADKAQLTGGGAKRSLGSVSDGAVYLGGEKHPRILLAEGVENALATLVLLGEGCPVATLGTAMLGKWTPPDWCESAFLYADGDKAGHTAAMALKRRMDAAGFQLRVQWLSGHKDANDLLLGTEVRNDAR